VKTVTGIGALIATVLVLTPLTGIAGGQGQGRGANQHQPADRAQVERGQSDFDRDRMRQRDRVDDPAHDRDRNRDRIHAPDSANTGNQGIYGNELMSAQERNQYREQLRLVESDPEQRTRFLAQHQEKMQVRAKQQGVNLDDKPKGPNDE
jgi:hypothetical protein